MRMQKSFYEIVVQNLCFLSSKLIVNIGSIKTDVYRNFAYFIFGNILSFKYGVSKVEINYQVKNFKAEYFSSVEVIYKNHLTFLLVFILEYVIRLQVSHF